MPPGFGYYRGLHNLNRVLGPIILELESGGPPNSIGNYLGPYITPP